ncbi:MAG: hypothetical protein MASP_01174 [Candidatus Methanolliviera sp. GoM_asphalt]|nr:MAG: hypothetical protein MASP_01174 [Candidatus Methanolliviera sp. GoM_asphalt]
MTKEESNKDKHFDSDEDCSREREESKKRWYDDVFGDDTPYFEEKKDLFDQKIDPVDEQWGDEEGEYDGRWGAYTDDKKRLCVDLKTLLNRLRTDYPFITPIDTKVLHIYLNGIYDPTGEEQIRSLLVRKFGTVAHQKTVLEVLHQLRDASFIRRGRVNGENGYLPLWNGILNLETLELETFSPDQIWTFKLPVKYDPKAKCPKFKKFLGEVFMGAEETIESIREQFGYCLYPQMPTQISFWWYGSGANEKTQLAEILRAMLGSKNVTHIDLRTLEHGRFDRRHLFGKLANIIGEPDPRILEKSTVFKACTGGDIIYSDVKNRDPIEFQNFSKFFIYANEYPQIADVSNAFWWRVLAVDFPNVFEGSNVVKDIGKRIAEAELSGILNWALEGLRCLKDNNWEFIVSSKEEEAKERLVMMSNPVHAFVDAECVMDVSAKTATVELYDRYKESCEERGIGIKSVDSFGRDLSRIPRISKGLVRYGGKREKGWIGIRLKE